MRALSKLTYAIRTAQRKHNILPSSSKILIALSGGQDSTALTEALLSLNRQTPWQGLFAVHCDHGWPLDCGNKEHVTEYAASRNLPLTVLSSDHEIPTKEAAAREWRYDVLGRFARNINCGAVVTGHTMTDVSETLLMGLCRGTVVSIPWERVLVDDVALVRPLLEVSRELTGKVCSEQGIKIWDDVYNADERYLRNRVRKRVIPSLRERINPRVEEGFSRVADVLREEDEFMDILCEEVYNKSVRHDRGVWLHAGLRHVHKAVRRRVVKKALGEIDGFGKCIYAVVESVCGVLEGGRGTWARGGAVVWVGDEVFVPPGTGRRTGESGKIRVKGNTERVPTPVSAVDGG